MMATRMAILCHGTFQTTAKEETNIITRLQKALVATPEFRWNMIVMEGFGTEEFETDLKNLGEAFPWYHRTVADGANVGSTMEKALHFVGKAFFLKYEMRTTEWPDDIFLIGWSRGAILAVQIANALDRTYTMVGRRHPSLYMCLLDPCYGPSSAETKEARTRLTCQLQDLRMVFAMERKDAHSMNGRLGFFPPHPPVYAAGLSPIKETVSLVPGTHRGIVENGEGQLFGHVDAYVKYLVYVWLAGHGIPGIVPCAFSQEQKREMWSGFLRRNPRDFREPRGTNPGLPSLNTIGGNDNIRALYEQNRGGRRTGRTNYFRTKEHYEVVKDLLCGQGLAGLRILACLNDNAPSPGRYNALLGNEYRRLWETLDKFDPDIRWYVTAICGGGPAHAERKSGAIRDVLLGSHSAASR